MTSHHRQGHLFFLFLRQWGRNHSFAFVWHLGQNTQLKRKFPSNWLNENVTLLHVTCYNKVVPHVTFVRRPPPTASPTRPCPKINIRREGLVRRPKGEAKAEQRPMEVNATPVWATYPHSPAAPPAAPHYRATKQRSRTP